MKSASQVTDNMDFGFRSSEEQDRLSAELAKQINNVNETISDTAKTQLASLTIPERYSLLKAIGFPEWVRHIMTTHEHYPSNEVLLNASPIARLIDTPEAAKIVKTISNEFNNLFVPDEGLDALIRGIKDKKLYKQNSYEAHPAQVFGTLFRSTQEVRYAMLFNRLGLDWQYEPIPYQTPLGTYLPDFWLPELDIHVEIKGMIIKDEAIIKLQSVCDQTGKIGVILSGYPDPHQIFESPWSTSKGYSRLAHLNLCFVKPTQKMTNEASHKMAYEASITNWLDYTDKAFEDVLYRYFVKAVEPRPKLDICNDLDALAAKRNSYYFDFKRKFYQYQWSSKDKTFRDDFKGQIDRVIRLIKKQPSFNKIKGREISMFS